MPISRWVLREGCRQARAWQDAGLPPLRIAINISAVELRSKDYVATVRTILAETGLDPRHLELELTESFLMHDSGAAIDAHIAAVSARATGYVGALVTSSPPPCAHVPVAQNDGG